MTGHCSQESEKSTMSRCLDIWLLKSLHCCSSVQACSAAPLCAAEQFWKITGEPCTCGPYSLEKCLVFISDFESVSFCFYEFMIPLAHICISKRRNSLLQLLDVSSNI